MPFGNGHLLLLSIYRFPQISINDQQWSIVFNFCDSFKAAILLSDFNAHHSDWDCGIIDKIYLDLFISSLDTSFTCINDGSPTFISPGQNKSILFLSLLLSYPLLIVLLFMITFSVIIFQPLLL